MKRRDVPWIAAVLAVGIWFACTATRADTIVVVQKKAAGGGALPWGWVLSNANGEYLQSGDCGNSCLNFMDEDNDWTVEFVYKSTDNDASDDQRFSFMARANGVGLRQVWEFSTDAEAASMRLYGDTGNEYSYPTDWEATVEDTTNWHHLAMSHNATAGTFEIYIDGVVKATAQSDAGYTSTADSDIVRLCEISPDGAGGKCTEMRIWNDIRTPTEIAAHDTCQLACDGGVDCPAGLTHYWKLNGAATGLDDEVGSDDVTLQGTMTWDDDTDEPFGGWTNDGSGTAPCYDDT